MYAFIVGALSGFVLFYLLRKHMLRSSDAPAGAGRPPTIRAFWTLVYVLAAVDIFMLLVGLTEIVCNTPHGPDEDFLFVFRRLLDEGHMSRLVIGLFVGMVAAIWLQPAIEPLPDVPRAAQKDELDLRLLKRKRLGWVVLFLGMVGFFHDDLRRALENVTQVSAPGGFSLTLASRPAGDVTPIPQGLGVDPSFPGTDLEIDDTPIQLLNQFGGSVVNRDVQNIKLLKLEPKKSSVYGNDEVEKFFNDLSSIFIEPIASCMYAIRETDRRRASSLRVFRPIKEQLSDWAMERGTMRGLEPMFIAEIKLLRAQFAESEYADRKDCLIRLDAILSHPGSPNRLVAPRDYIRLPYPTLIAAFFHEALGERSDATLLLARWLQAAEDEVRNDPAAAPPLWLRLRVATHMMNSFSAAERYEQQRRLLSFYLPQFQTLIEDRIRPYTIEGLFLGCGSPGSSKMGKGFDELARTLGLDADAKIGWQRIVFVYINMANNYAFATAKVDRVDSTSVVYATQVKAAADYVRCFLQVPSANAPFLTARFLDTYAYALTRRAIAQSTAGGEERVVARDQLKLARESLSRAAGILQPLARQAEPDRLPQPMRVEALLQQTEAALLLDLVNTHQRAVNSLLARLQ